MKLFSERHSLYAFPNTVENYKMPEERDFTIGLTSNSKTANNIKSAVNNVYNECGLPVSPIFASLTVLKMVETWKTKGKLFKLSFST